MPILRFETGKRLDDSEKEEIAERLTLLTSQLLNKDPKVTVVLVSDGHANQKWHLAGRACEQGEAGSLSISITAGTNTEKEKTAWIAAAAQAVGFTDPNVPNYISIHELDGTDWGYDGLSQKHRKEQSK